MIVSHIIGGLGNQMFQYAAGRALALKHRQPLYLDTSGFETYKNHDGFQLSNAFDTKFEIASQAHLNELLGWRAGKRLRSWLRRPKLANFRGNNFIVQPGFEYWQNFTGLKENCYLDGYWQSEKFFENYKTIISDDFSFKQTMSVTNQILSSQIRDTNSVSIHVRRGDYTDPKTFSVHGLCTIEYYQAAINYIIKQVHEPFFYIFSDDMEWVKKNLHIRHDHQFISHNNQEESYNDMRLMSLCRHNIIANSTFSWWGAWLNKRYNKIVITPKNWFKVESNTNDLIPVDWMKL